MIDAMDGDLNEDYQNWLSSTGTYLREGSKEFAPIYQKPTSGEFNYGDSGWWAQNGVSVVSSISMFIPGWAATKGVGMAARGLRKANALTRGLKGAKTSAAIANTLNLSRTAKWLTKSTIMGVSSRHMENYREAAETFATSFDKNMEYFGNQEKLDEYLKTTDGESMLNKLGLNVNSRNLRETASKYIAGKGASKSYNMNYANLAFDIAQSALFFRGVGRSTRAGFFGHSRSVKGANNAILKAPKLPKTRFGKILARTPRARHIAFWSATEGVEEMWNYVSMQEGIHYGDVLAGNTGWENREFNEGNFADRMNKYAASGEMWTAALMGTIGGGIFTGISHARNRKGQQARDAEAIKEINNRVDFLRESLKKRQKAEQRGDVNGMKEQDELMGLEMALNAARSGTTDLLVDMLADPIYEELLGEYGITADAVAGNRKALTDIILKTEKKFNKYVNRITGTKYSYGVANALTNMDMAVDIYQNLIENVDDQLNNLDDSDAKTQQQFSIGPNTKKRYELKAKREALQTQLDQLNFSRAQVASEVTNPDATAEEKQEAKDTLALIDSMIKKVETTQSVSEKESADLASDSNETYDAEALAAENKFLNEVNTDTRAYLEQRKGQFESNRDAAWTQLQDMLNGKLETTKDGKNQNEFVDQAFKEENERENVKRQVAEGREDIAKSAETRGQENVNNAIKQDFIDLINNNPNITEQEIRDFFQEHQDNPIIAEYGREVINTFLTWESKQGFQNLIDEMRAESAEVADEIAGNINKSFADLHKELFNPKLSRSEEARRVAIEQEQRDNKVAWNKGMYGEKSSQDLLLKDLFDGFTKFVPVIWGEKQGMIYRDPETNELIFREGETNKEFIVAEENSEKVYRNTKGQFTNGPTLGYLDMLLLRDSNLDINIEADGRTFKINGEFFNNLFSEPGSAIEYDAEANIVSVSLTRWDGKKVTFTSPAITYELADVIETLEAVKRTRFRDLVQNDFMIIDYKGEDFIVNYGQTDLFTETLIARDQNGNILTGEQNEGVLRAANAMLSISIQNEINKLKQKYNETTNAQPDVAGGITKNIIEQDEVGPSEASERAAKQQEAFAAAEGTTSNTNPTGEQSETSLEEQTVLIDNVEKKVNENNLNEEETVNPENPAVLENTEKLEIIDATSNQKSGQTSQEKSTPIITEDNPTNTTVRVLKQTFPQAWAPQHMSNLSQFGEYQSMRDSNGNLIELIESPTGKASNLVFLDELTGPQLEALAKGDPKLIRLYIFEPLLDQSGTVKKEGTKVLESEKLVEFQMKRGDKVGPAVRVQIKDDAVKSSDIFDNKLLNSPELGVGTKVILRVEKSWPYFQTTAPGQGVVTVRLASDPNVILTTLSSADKAQGTNGVLRKKIALFMKEHPGRDIPATIAGKTAGFFINLKHDGKSIQQSLKILGDDILLGVDLGGQGVNWNNTNENNFESEYTEQGRVYVRIKSANGIGYPARVQTSNLTDEAVKIILDTLTSENATAEEKRLIVEQLVYIPRGASQDAQFKLGSKTTKTFAAEFDVSMDNFVIKFPFRGQVIGVQYNMEGRKGNVRNNLQNALEGGEFLYKAYDEHGNVTSEVDLTTTQDTKRSTLRNSTALNLAPTEIRDALTEHLKSKKFNVQKHKINDKSGYHNPLREQGFANYNDFLIEMNILTTDIPGQGQQKVNHSRIFLDVPSTVFTPAEKQVPAFLEDKEVVLTPVPAVDENDYVVESSTSYEDLQKEDTSIKFFDIVNREYTKNDALFPTTEQDLAAGTRSLYDSGVPVKLSIDVVNPIDFISSMSTPDMDLTVFRLSVGETTIGQLVVNPANNQIENVEFLKEFRGLGLGTKIYKAANAELGGLVSDTELVSANAQRVWESLVRQGLAQKVDGAKTKWGKNVGYVMIGSVMPQVIKKVDPTDDSTFDVQLRKYEEVEGNYDIISDVEKAWVLERFGEESLDIVNRVKYMTLKDGRQAFGYYHNGLMTVAEGAVAGTAYWEAFRRIYDIHLTPDEKTSIEMEVIAKWNADQANELRRLKSELKHYEVQLKNQQGWDIKIPGKYFRDYDQSMENETRDTIESIKNKIKAFNAKPKELLIEEIGTKLAEEFMDYQLTENDTGFGATIKRFFRDLLYYIKNMLGMRSEIEYLFRDLNNRDYTKYTAEEAAALSKVKVEQLREKKGYNSDQTKEIVGNLNYVLSQALKAKYAKTANPEGWRDALTQPNELKGAYESIRQQWKATGEQLSQSTDENTRLRGENALAATETNVWYDVPDEFGNIISPGFQALAVRGLRAQFGVKYKIKKGGEINYETAEVEEAITDEQMDQVEIQPVNNERIFGMNFYNTPVKQTLSRDIKFELGFIVERDSNGNVVKGDILGLPTYMAFDEVYAYLSVNLANSPQGKVIAKLNKLAANGHAMMDQIVKIYGKGTAQFQNKFVTHFNKQNIRFETVIHQKNGQAKIVETNRNGLENQILRKWIDTRDQTDIYSPVTGKEDALDPRAIDILKESYDLTTKLSRENASKEDYLASFKATLDYAGIRLSPEAYMGLLNDETLTVRNLNSYMVGNSSFEHIMKALMQFTNPYLKGSAETTALKRLAGLDAAFRIDNYAASFLSGSRKPIYAINLNTYDSKTTLDLRSEETYEQAILERFRDVFYSPTDQNRHLILDTLLNNKEARDNFLLSTFDVIKESANAGKVSSYNEMSQALSATTRFIMFHNSGLHYGKFNTGTKGDKNQSKYIQLPKIGARAKFGLWRSNKLGKEGLIETAVQLLRPALMGELARIAKTNNQLFGPNPISLDEQVQYVHYLKKKGDNLGQGLKFVQFPSLNNSPEFFTPEGRLLQGLVNMSDMSIIGNQNALLNTHLEKYIVKEMESTLDSLVEAGVVEKKITGVYENILLPSASYEGKTTAELGILPALQEFAINDLVYKPYINTTFGPDLAYYKPDETGNPIIEFGKRAYQSITPGMDAVYNEEKQYGLPSTFAHAILADVIVDSKDHINKILTDAGVSTKIAKRISAAYERVNSTDAQGYTTLDFHRKQMESDGAWSPEHTIAYDTYWSKGLMGDAKAKMLLLDPRKTYYFGERVTVDSQGNENLVWEQIKHSTIPLIREFTELFKEDPGNGKVTLNQLRIRMEDKARPIDMVNFESAVKVGARGILNLATRDLNTIPVNMLQTRHLRSPQTIETKFKSPLDGTQMAKLVLSNVELSSKYKMFDTSMSGQEVIDLYNNVYAERIKRSHDALSKTVRNKRICRCS